MKSFLRPRSARFGRSTWRLLLLQATAELNHSTCITTLESRGESKDYPVRTYSFAPRDLRSSSIPLWPALCAAISAVRPLLSLVLTSAPLSSRRVTISR